MRWARFRRINLVLTVVIVLLVGAWVLGPVIGLPGPSFAYVVAAMVLVGVNIVIALWTFRGMRLDAARVVAAHPGAIPSVITSWEQLAKDERESIIAVVADRRGLSFRDHDDREVQLIPADHILSLELAPLEPRARFRPFRVTTTNGAIDFSGPAKPDDQVDAVVALRTALGRQPG
ncbi:MAG: hypothetical protein ABL886_08965 [Rhodoglobus sp.]